MFEHLLATRAYWNGQWVDLWSIPHTLFGVMVAFAAALAGLGVSVGYGIVASLALAWEIFERLSGIGSSETPTNSLADILCALVGFALGVWLLRYVKDKDARRILLVLMTIVWGVINFLGWIAYQHYAAGTS